MSEDQKKPEPLGIDPLTLIISMLKAKNIINENELSWIMNCHMISAGMRSALLDDMEDALATLEVMKTRSFFEIRLRALAAYACKCGGEIEDIDPLTLEEKLKMQYFPYRCKKCKKQLSPGDLVPAKKKKEKPVKSVDLLKEVEKAEKEIQGENP